jgi:CRISPR-associated protein Cmr2
VRDAVKDAEPAVADTGDGPSDTPTKPSRKARVTASAGIAIAHHYTSLSYVRRVSEEAERLAKHHYGRNALVVTVLRRSGEQTRVGCHWRYRDLVEEAQPVPLFLSFYDLFREDILSPKCVFNLLEEAPTLVGLKPEAQGSEIKRVLRRQRGAGMEEWLSDEEIQKKAGYLVALALAMDEEQSDADKERGLALELHADSRRYGLVEVLGWLLVMLFLARKEQE